MKQVAVFHRNTQQLKLVQLKRILPVLSYSTAISYATNLPHVSESAFAPVATTVLADTHLRP